MRANMKYFYRIVFPLWRSPRLGIPRLFSFIKMFSPTRENCYLLDLRLHSSRKDVVNERRWTEMLLQIDVTNKVFSHALRNALIPISSDPFGSWVSGMAACALQAASALCTSSFKYRKITDIPIIMRKDGANAGATSDYLQTERRRGTRMN